ncbi:hypothetical protein FTO70_14345 [Methanosarcina sp. KYL-1]|uniref:hypothetical protein n=1 Tax=Methanosarcina sp. KYL-1 TaxID=2602068 RepID=UPI002100EF78|nr:hypothetical protein [Methanosarcina sp. KYL-1]MCQ1536830.1 hypothetical protein [Methanosarcina sp. KYL-1]
MDLKISKVISILLVITPILFFSGCTSSSGDQNGALADPESAVNQTVEELENVEDVTEEPLGVPELKIMSVTQIDGNLNIKVKNVGNGTAKDVYCGVIVLDGDYVKPNRFDGTADSGIYLSYIPEDEYNLAYVYEAAVMALDSPTPVYVDTQNTTNTYYGDRALVIRGEVLTKDYLGDVAPGELKETSMGIVSPHHAIFAKMAWTDDKSQIAFY